jgi:hypothetical protein
MILYRTGCAASARRNRPLYISVLWAGVNQCKSDFMPNNEPRPFAERYCRASRCGEACNFFRDQELPAKIDADNRILLMGLTSEHFAKFVKRANIELIEGRAATSSG